MAIKIVSPTLNQVVQAILLPFSVRVTAIADSNIETDVVFKLDGVVVGTDPTATTKTVNGVKEYHYSLLIPVSSVGLHSIEVEDINPSKNPVVVRSTAQSTFGLQVTPPTVKLTQGNR